MLLNVNAPFVPATETKLAFGFAWLTTVTVIVSFERSKSKLSLVHTLILYAPSADKSARVENGYVTVALALMFGTIPVTIAPPFTW